ncbi:MAG: GH92 family glycosyl hydrolase [Candidatus Alcyoniella australis]|nr:GH92 family glycosyl hydrolase [Candidatus Alcyoniella australis]
MSISRFFLFLLLLIVLLCCGVVWSGCDTDDDDDDDDDVAGDDDDDDDDDNQPLEPLELVDVFIGTGGQGFGQGSLLPGPSMPWGMVKLSPDTSVADLQLDFTHYGGYYYGDKQIRGFTHTHIIGTGAGDAGNLLLMPTRGFETQTGDTLESYYRSSFSHDTEQANPGYYSVLLDRYYIHAELTATEHAGMHRYTFPEASDAQVVINAGNSIQPHWVSAAQVNVDQPNSAVYGWLDHTGGFAGRDGGYILYFVVEFDRPFTHYGTFVGRNISPGSLQALQDGTGIENQAGAYVEFDADPDTPVVARVGISYISLEQARINLAAEIPDFDFDDVRTEAENGWREVLEQFEVDGGTDLQREIFYSAVYHLYMMPSLFSEVGEIYRGFDRELHADEGHRFYSDMSLWDTFRSFHTLIDLINPEAQLNFLNSMVRMYQQGGSFPKWPRALGYTGCMIGTSADIVFAGSYLKGIDNFNVNTAYEGLRLHGLGPTEHGRTDMQDYLALGYCSIENGSKSVSNTLENCYDDYALGLWAQALGHDEDAERFLAQSRNWINLFDKPSGFLRARHRDGSWVDSFIPLWFSEDYCEGNAYHWSFYVPYDVDELAFAHGGRDVLIYRLEQMFQNSVNWPNTPLPDIFYWHGNEPDILVPYLFNELGRPDLTQKWVRWVMDAHYTGGPDGVDGNDDGGTLSAWYVFSAMGIYSLPGTDIYYIASPIFENLVLHRDQGDITITAHNASPDNIYVQSVQLNGEPLDEPIFHHDQIADGATFEFVMGPQPSGWGRE